ncbi:dual specificity protein phosphatase, putative [Trypanosoma brucei gambiense DAL972]|uniref:Dual specificity protein phosphatase, putative n=1 Tax=Trypanosoma brucei gambiense (strain MHOM/CI/86/DAL972) TaxID=679716 RepID=D0A7Y6_TRYB9|nr:dual specificity protein phosphatase, putative [Trypanosoma brucei gambiense DAL972]CBH17787.1 dual specificity protein phosphatase, putative [Trypanosoma brucei gambiense DAL972]|eukprot:XP_011780051.1 dual specificity protein phosphatase, putative [Trypanosoma brucei gambiense DAL972]
MTLEKVDWTVPRKLLPKDSLEVTDSANPYTEFSEILPGLYLTAEERVCNRARSIEESISLILTLNGGEHVAPYRIYEYLAEDQRYVYKKICSFNVFASLLEEYASTSVPEDPLQRKVFIRSVPAEDCPTYDISRHFPEMCALIELVMMYRRDTEVELARLHTVVVHCLMGVSRSAAVVAAYMMKRGRYSKDESVFIMRKSRPIVSPNPGFQKQLMRWEEGAYYRISDMLSATLAASEVRGGTELNHFIERQLRLLLRERRFIEDRKNFGYVISSVLSITPGAGSAVLMIAAHINQCIVEEVYVDVPSFFSNVSDIVKSIFQHMPNFINDITEEFGDPFDDCFYFEMVKAIGCSGAGKCLSDVAKAFSSLLETVHATHMINNPRSVPYWADSEDEIARGCPEGMRLSFTFLPFFAPYAVGFVQLRYSGELMNEEGLYLLQVTSSRISPPSEDKISELTCNATADGCAIAVDIFSCMVSQVGHLKDDVELEMLNAVLGGSTLLAVIDKFVYTEEPNEGIALLWMRKVVGGAVGIRLFFDAIDRYLMESYLNVAEIGTIKSIADEKAPWVEIATSIQLVNRVYMEQYGKVVDFLPWILQELSSMIDNGAVVVPSDISCSGE